MKRGWRLGLALFLLLLAGLWRQIPDVNSGADIDAQLGRDSH
jgi:hypothetical protein